MGSVLQAQGEYDKAQQAIDAQLKDTPKNADLLARQAELFHLRGRWEEALSELKAAIQEMLDHDGPYVLDVIVPYTEHVLPMIPAGKTVKDMILK